MYLEGVCPTRQDSDPSWMQTPWMQNPSWVRAPPRDRQPLPLWTEGMIDQGRIQDSSQEGRQYTNLADFLKKLHEIKEILVCVGRGENLKTKTRQNESDQGLRVEQ